MENKWKLVRDLKLKLFYDINLNCFGNCIKYKQFLVKYNKV